MSVRRRRYSFNFGRSWRKRSIVSFGPKPARMLLRLSWINSRCSIRLSDHFNHTSGLITGCARRLRRCRLRGCFSLFVMDF